MWRALLSGLSLEAKFGLLLALGALPVLTAISLGAWYFVQERSQFYEEQSLDLAGALLRAHIAGVRNARELAAGGPAAIGADLLAARHIGALVHDAQGQVLVSSLRSGMDEAVLAARGFGASHTDWSGPNGAAYRVLALDARLADRAPLRMVLLLDTGTPTSVQHAYQTVFIVIALAGGMFTVAVGILLVQTGLEPLRRLTERARDITASRLGDRLGIEDAPTELRDLADSLNAMLQRLQDSFRRLDEFSSDLAHELRTPIGNMLGQSEVALSRARSVEEYRAVLESNIEEFHRLSRMIQDMLFLAQAEGSARALTLEAVDLGEQVDKVLEYYEPLIEEKHIRVQRTGAGSARANRLLVQRAVANLISNAVRHAPERSTLHVEIAAPQADQVALRVTNSGNAIAAEDLPWIFQRLFRGRTAKASTEGWGLGLAIVKAIMDMHGGRATVHSSEGGETSFTLVFSRAASST